MEYSDKVWTAIKKEWLAGQLSVSDISRSYGPTRQAIRAKAKRYKWGKRGSLVDEVRKEIASQLLEDEGVPAGVPPSEASDIVETAAKRGVAVVRRQRDLLAQILDLAGATLQELREMDVIRLESLKKKSTKQQVALVASLTKAKFDGLKVLSGLFSQTIPLERQAYSIDKDEGSQLPIKYVAPDYKKPPHSGLSEDDWDDDENDDET